MLGLYPIAGAPIGGSPYASAANTVPTGTGTIDATKVPLSRQVLFEGSKRVVSFEGSIRKVRF